MAIYNIYLGNSTHYLSADVYRAHDAACCVLLKTYFEALNIKHI